MKHLKITYLLLMLFIMVTSCEKVNLNDDNDTPEEKETQKTGKTYKVNIMARSTSATAITYPINIYATDSDGDIVAQQTITSSADDISLQLTSGSYTITAISGSTDFTKGYITEPLQIGHSDIDVETTSTSVNIIMSYAVTSLNVSMSDIPANVTDVSLSVSDQYLSISNTGTYSGSGKCSIPCTKQNDGTWTTGKVYLLPGCGTATVLTLSIKSASGTESYGITYASPLKAAVPYSFTGTYSGTGSAGIKVTGTLSYGEWENEVLGTFSFGPTGSNSFNGTTTVETYNVSALPKQGSVWNGHVVAYIDGCDALLISLLEWKDLTSALYEADPDVPVNIATSYTEGDITEWAIPTSDQARLLRTCWKGSSLATLNTAMTDAGGTALSLTDDGKNVRYLCQDATYTYSFAESSSITAAGKTVKTYRLRLVKPVTFVVNQ